MENQQNKVKTARDISSFARAREQMVAKSREAYGDYDYLSGARASRRLRKYSLKEIDEIISSGSLAEQRILSRNYFSLDGLYKRILLYYATLMKGAGLLAPVPAYGKQLSADHIQKRYYNALNYIDKLHLEEFETKVALRALIDGCYYGVIQRLDKNDLVLLDLPARFARSCYKDIYGRDIIEFDVTYFSQITDKEEREEELSLFPSVISKYYRRYAKGRETCSWVKVPSELGVCFSFTEDGAPLFLSTIPATIQYDEAVDTERERDLDEIRKILIQKIPHLQDGSLLFEPEEAVEMHAGTVEMMAGNKNVSVLTTYADVDSIVSKTSSDAVSNNLEKMLQNVYAEASVSAQLFSPTGAQALDNSIRNDMSFMMILMNKIARFVTDLVNGLFGNTNISFKYTILPITYYNQSEFITDSMKLAQSGYSYLLPSIAIGVGQRELLGIKELENEALGLRDKLIPLASSYTESAGNGPGRPTKTTEQKAPSTIQKEESINKQGGVKTDE